MILDSLGAGGMGEVYRGRDERLRRDVAIKILPDAVAGNPERVARFEREAQVLANLNQPNIGAIYGIGAASGIRFLVLELIDGETLASRLGRVQPPIGEVLRIADGIATALEAAHDKGIVHRDLKPANVMVAFNGQVKVVDFGLAKDIRAATSPDGLTTAQTTEGSVLGTAGYMSPEQASGHPTDARTDIWAFGCILYEMLAGRPAFKAGSFSETVASVLRDEPQWEALPDSTPPMLVSLMRRCLAKDRQQRLASLSVARFVIEESNGAPPSRHAPQSRPRALVLALTAAVIVLAGTLALVWLRPTTSPSMSGARFLIAAPADTDIVTGQRNGASAAISPDGTTVAFTAQGADDKTYLWTRRLDAFSANRIAATEGASFPFWSPDSTAIAFFSGSRLMRVGRDGSEPPTAVCDVVNGRGGTWNRDDVIVYGTQTGPLYRVAASGGRPTALIAVGKDEGDHRFPVFLPDGRHVLFYLNTAKQGLAIASLDGGSVEYLFESDSTGWYSNGHLLFVRASSLMAIPFEPSTRRSRGAAFPVAAQVQSGVYSGVQSFSVSETGTLAHGVGARSGDLSLVLVDRRGSVIDTLATGPYVGVDLSPDGRRVVAHRHDADGGDLWLFTLGGGNTRLTNGGENSFPLWSPDGRSIVYTRGAAGRWEIVRASTSGEAPQTLLEYASFQAPVASAWTQDETLLFTSFGSPTAGDIWSLPLRKGAQPQPFLNLTFTETSPAISPDGRWVAYASDETGQRQIFVRRFPSGDGKRQVSILGGTFPRWRGDGQELYYTRADTSKIVAAAVAASTLTSLEFEDEQELFAVRYRQNFTRHSGHLLFDVSADGQRFVVPQASVAERESLTPDTIAISPNVLQTRGQ